MSLFWLVYGSTQSASWRRPLVPARRSFPAAATPATRLSTLARR